jgi:uroporphyrin-3 C-methyltransferase
VNTENTGLENDTPEHSVTGEAEEPSSQPDTLPVEEPAAAGPPARRGGFLAFLAFVFSLAAVGLTAWMWWQDQAEVETDDARMLTEISRLEAGDQELTRKITQLGEQFDALAEGDVSGEFQALQGRLQNDREQVAELDRQMREQLALTRSLQTAVDSTQGRLQAAEAAVASLSTRELDAGGELDLAEVDYLLRLANERLKLFSDPAAADQALEVADLHLAALDNPMYLGVRQEIAAARRQLAAVELPDYLAIANRLDEIQAAVPELPFRGETPAAGTGGEAAGDGWWDKVKSVFSGLVTVRRSTEDDLERISLQDKDYIRERVWLQLEIAHLSLMQRDQEMFRGSLDRVRESVDQWFNPQSGAVQDVEAGLDELAGVPIEVEVPDITGPWSTLRLLRNRPAAAPVPVESVEEETESAGDDNG